MEAIYYKLPLDADLSQTSYRDRRDTDTHIYIEYNEGFVGENWVAIEESELIAEFGCNPFVVTEETAELPEVSEQDEINARILLNQADILARLSEQDEVQAQILLNQTGV
jgi:hypothetical protein